jgi:hypothetical protein
MKRTPLINPGKAAGLSIRSPRMGILREVQKMKIANATTKQATRKSLSWFDIFYSPLITKSPLAPEAVKKLLQVERSGRDIEKVLQRYLFG